jgi:hypothetical protein
MNIQVSQGGLHQLRDARSGQTVAAAGDIAALAMSRPDHADARQVSCFIFVLLIGFFLLPLLAFQPPGPHLLTDADVYWHVATGQRIFETGSLPHTDEFSHTFQGHPWTAENWLGDLMLSGAFGLGGWRGVVLITACAIAVSYALLFLALSCRMRLTVAIGIAATAYTFSNAHFCARPQIFVDSLMILWVAGLVNAVDNRTSPPLLLLPIMTIWANIHPSCTLGLALAGALATEAFFRGPGVERIQVAKRWAIFLTFAVIAACLTPYGYQPILHAFQVMWGNEALPYIQEWMPIPFQLPGIGPPLLGLLFLAMYKGVKVPFWRLLIILGLIYLMMSHIRFFSHFAIVTPLLLAEPLTRQFPFLRLSTQLEQDPGFFRVMQRARRRGFYPACALVLCGLAVDGAWGRAVSAKAIITPAGAVDYLEREHLTGNIYNPYNFGGYLIFKHIKTFIDGRTEELFLDGFITRMYDVTHNHPRQFVAFIEEYNVTLALVRPDSIESQELAASSGWEKVYSDKVAELYRRRS